MIDDLKKYEVPNFLHPSTSLFLISLLPVILLFIIRNICLIFILVSGTELLKPLEFLEMRVINVFCFVNEVTLEST